MPDPYTWNNLVSNQRTHFIDPVVMSYTVSSRSCWLNTVLVWCVEVTAEAPAQRQHPEKMGGTILQDMYKCWIADLYMALSLQEEEYLGSVTKGWKQEWPPLPKLSVTHWGTTQLWILWGLRSWSLIWVYSSHGLAKILLNYKLQLSLGNFGLCVARNQQARRVITIFSGVIDPDQQE